MNPRARFQPPGMGSGSMHPNTNSNFQPRNPQQYIQRGPAPYQHQQQQQHFQNQQTQQWLRRNQSPSADSTVDEVEKTVQAEAVDQRSGLFSPFIFILLCIECMNTCKI